MAKKKQDTVSASDPIQGLREALVSGLGIGAASAVSSYDSLVGIPIPSLAMQWFLNTSVLPLSRIIEIAGAPECCKSTFMYEVIRWFLMAGGQVALFETEGKDNAALRHGVLKNDPEFIDRIVVIPVVKYESWVKGCTEAMKYYADFFRKSGAGLPVMVCVDSLTAAPLETQIKEMDKEGHTNADYPRMAKALSNDLKQFPGMLADSPISFVYTNHMKKDFGGLGIAEDKSSGGRGPEYHKSLGLKFSPAMRESRFTRANLTGRRLKVTTTKNSIGPKRDVEIVIYYTYEDNPVYDPESPISERYALNVNFDWGEVDIKFLLSVIQGNRDGFGTETRRKIAEICDFNVVSRQNSATWLWSSSLGIPEDSPVPFSQAGALLLSSPDMLRCLQDELHIKRNPEFHSGMNFRELVESCICEQERLSHKVINSETMEVENG